MTIENETLLKFCEKGNVRHLDKPFNDDKYTYATNGHICLRIEKQPEFDLIDEKQPKHLSSIIESLDKNNLVEINNLPLLEKENCTNCNGVGSFKECQYCDGDGHLECYLGHEHDCEECEGKGTINENGNIECVTCKGSGEKYKELYYKIGCRYINAYYARLIASLPNSKISVSGKESDPKALYFEFDGGCGAVMPVRYLK